MDVSAARKGGTAGDPPGGGARASRPPIKDQISAGGVAYRERDRHTEVVIVSVGERRRWQLPKGLVGAGEPPEAAAMREVREEAGVETELVAPIETIEYWYQAREGGAPVRFHKLVHFYLMRYAAGDVADHDHEVHEARWFEIGEAERALAFPNEKRVVARAREMIEEH